MRRGGEPNAGRHRARRQQLEYRPLPRHPVLATGFTYSIDVTFTRQTDPEPRGCGMCAPHIAPTQRAFVVDNPTATCIAVTTDAGGDATAGE